MAEIFDVTLIDAETEEALTSAELTAIPRAGEYLNWKDGNGEFWGRVDYIMWTIIPLDNADALIGVTIALIRE